MSIAQRVFKQAKDLSDLNELAKLIANPKAISDAAELAKKEAAAVQELIDEANEAKSILANRDILIAEIDVRKKSLADDAADLKSRSEKFDNFLVSENERMASFSAQLNLTASKIKEKESEIAAEWKKLGDERRELNNRVNAAMSSANKREEDAQKAIDDAKKTMQQYEVLMSESRLKAANLAKIASEM